MNKCPICTINLYGDEKLQVDVKTEKGLSVTQVVGKPEIFPCGVYREKQGRCPWETERVQKGLDVFHEHEKVAGLLGTMHGNE
jgi:hypothetical protein